MSELKIILPVAIGLIFATGSAVWAAPLPATPGTCTAAEKLTIPGCNPPINISGTAQVKTGGLSVGSLLVNTGAVVMGRLGVGTANPASILHVVDTDTTGKGIGMTFENTSTVNSFAGFNMVVGGVNRGAIHAGTAALGWGFTQGLILSAGNALDDISFKIGPGTYNGSATGPAMVLKGGTGYVGIGTSTPRSAFHVNGAVTITDGTQGAGKVLTSDANGKASWGTGGSGGVVATGMYGYGNLITSYSTTVWNGTSYIAGLGNFFPGATCQAVSPAACVCSTGYISGNTCYSSKILGIFYSPKSWSVACSSGFTLKKTGESNISAVTKSTLCSNGGGTISLSLSGVCPNAIPGGQNASIGSVVTDEINVVMNSYYSCLKN